jgi:hypothetical protein
METALDPSPSALLNDAHATFLSEEALIRTLGVSLVAIAAIVASLAVVRQRQELPQAPEGEKKLPHTGPVAAVDLDQLRAAGF